MASRIQIKRSTVPGKVPTTAQIELGELAINTRDGKLYLKRDNGNGTSSVIELGAVRSVAGKTGDVALSKSDIGLGAVDNTSDADKPISSAQEAALNTKVATTRQVATGTGLTGGGTLASDRTLSADIASEAEARAGAAQGKLMSALRTEQHMLANALGWGQSWAQVSRIGNTVYDNSSGRPIMVSYHATSSSQCFLSVAAPGNAWVNAAVARYGVSASAVVPAGWQYRFSYTPSYVVVLSRRHPKHCRTHSLSSGSRRITSGSSWICVSSMNVMRIPQPAKGRISRKNASVSSSWSST